MTRRPSPAAILAVVGFSVFVAADDLTVVSTMLRPIIGDLGLVLPDDHETRYGYAQEWFDVVRKLWQSEEHFDWDGKYFNLKRVKGDPRPVAGQPPILNAAGSPQGRGFATDNANFLFTPAIDLARSKDEIVELKAQAAAKALIVSVTPQPIGPAVLEDTARRIATLRATTEAKEGLGAFLDKRPASWMATD